jgi:putative two-component system response regulator
MVGAPHVLVIDDSDVSADVLSRHLAADGYLVDVANDGITGLEQVRRLAPDLVLLDVMMPGMNGFEVCRAIKGDAQTRLIPVVLVTTLDDRTDVITGVEAGADGFMTKPVDVEQLRARVRSLLSKKNQTDDLDSAEGVIVSLAMTVEARDPYTRGHCQRLVAFSSAIGEELALGPADMRTLSRGALLHDVGKIGVPDSVLLKPGRLTPEELLVMRSHAVVGAQLVANFKSLQPARAIIRSHHERLDGSGYPDGLRGDAIPFLAQIIGIVDVFDALTTVRPYRRALTPRDAADILRDEAARGLHNPVLVDILVGLHNSGALYAEVSAAMDAASDPAEGDRV